MTSTWRVGRAWRQCGKAASTAMLAAVLGGANPAYAAGRVALVIGVGEYTHVTPLANPTKDAALIAQTLRQVGFDVTEVTHASQESQAGLTAAIQAFKAKAGNAEAAIIYYAGHGVELDGKNYLLPVEVEAKTAEELTKHAIPTQDAITAVGSATRVQLVILDACRDNPFAATRSLGDAPIGATRGLARETNLTNAAVLLATQPGLKASDGTGGNSPFAQALANAINAEGLPLPLLPTRLLNLMKNAGITQKPDLRGILTDETWAFRPGHAPSIPVIIGSGTKASEFGLVLQGRSDGLVGVIVSQVDRKSPYFGILRPNDVITRLNAQAVSDPASIFDRLKDNGRVSINLDRDGGHTMQTLQLPRQSED